MLKTLKYLNKMLELSKNKEEINKYSLKIYSILLGYFSNKKDRSFSFFDAEEDDLLKELENRILELTNIKYKKILRIRDNNKDSFNIFINNINNQENNELCELLNKDFNYGYDSYDYYNRKKS